MPRIYIMVKINRKNITKITSWIGWALFALILLCSTVSFVDSHTGYNVSFFGFRSSVISTGSMSKVHESNKERLDGFNDQLQVGDIIFTEEYKSYEEIKENDIITYFNGVVLICHRVVDKVIKEEKYYVITQGDANATTDGLVSFDSVKGKVVSVLPKIGYISLYLQSTYGIIGIC